MQNNTTSVSICICTYNQALYLEQAVRSAFQQTLLPIEIIVSDDCSTDETPQVLKRLSEELPLLKVIR
ncbi:MAG: glycosyl transferase, partial [Mucilaginibacter sp.]|nr:glycosyl transferase [Mucilaginibacter sp.]